MCPPLHSIAPHHPRRSVPGLPHARADPPGRERRVSGCRGLIAGSKNRLVDLLSPSLSRRSSCRNLLTVPARSVVLYFSLVTSASGCRIADICGSEQTARRRSVKSGRFRTLAGCRRASDARGVASPPGRRFRSGFGAPAMRLPGETRWRERPRTHRHCSGRSPCRVPSVAGGGLSYYCKPFAGSQASSCKRDVVAAHGGWLTPTGLHTSSVRGRRHRSWSGTAHARPGAANIRARAGRPPSVHGKTLLYGRTRWLGCGRCRRYKDSGRRSRAPCRDARHRRRRYRSVQWQALSGAARENVVGVVAPGGGVAAVVGANIAVVAAHDRADACPPGARIAGGADTGVIAGEGVVGMDAPGGGAAGVVSAWIQVVAVGRRAGNARPRGADIVQGAGAAVAARRMFGVVSPVAGLSRSSVQTLLSSQLTNRADSRATRACVVRVHADPSLHARVAFACWHCR